jgi:hypothetical protein
MQKDVDEFYRLYEECIPMASFLRYILSHLLRKNAMEKKR